MILECKGIARLRGSASSQLYCGPYIDHAEPLIEGEEHSFHVRMLLVLHSFDLRLTVGHDLGKLRRLLRESCDNASKNQIFLKPELFLRVTLDSHQFLKRNLDIFAAGKRRRGKRVCKS